jgi:hypothetical protein
MVALLEAPDTAALDRVLSRLFELPVVSRALATYVKALMADAELGKLGDDVLKAVVAAPEVRAAIAGLIDAG